MEPVKFLLVFVGIVIIFAIVIIIFFEMSLSAKKVRMGLLVITAQIKKDAPIIGGFLEAAVKTFIWF